MLTTIRNAHPMQIPQILVGQELRLICFPPFSVNAWILQYLVGILELPRLICENCDGNAATSLNTKCAGIS